MKKQYPGFNVAGTNFDFTGRPVNLEDITKASKEVLATFPSNKTVHAGFINTTTTDELTGKVTLTPNAPYTKEAKKDDSKMVYKSFSSSMFSPGQNSNNKSQSHSQIGGITFPEGSIITPEMEKKLAQHQQTMQQVANGAVFSNVSNAEIGAIRIGKSIFQPTPPPKPQVSETEIVNFAEEMEKKYKDHEFYNDYLKPVINSIHQTYDKKELSSLFNTLQEMEPILNSFNESKNILS